MSSLHTFGRRRARALAIAVCATVVGGAPVARAAPTQEEGAMASALFEQGRALMAEARYDEACERLAESQRLEPAGGTLLNLAECRRLQGRTATAYTLYTDALALARRDRRDDRVEVCKKAMAELAARLTTLRVVVPERSRCEGLVIRMNGVVVPEIARGTDLPIDPGIVTIEAEAKDRAPRSWQVTVVDAGHVEVSIDPLEPLVRAAATDGPHEAPHDGAVPLPGSSDPIAGRPAAMLRVDIDGRGRGAVGYVGMAYGVASFLEVGAGALLGASSGLEAGVRLFVPLPVVRPYVTVAAPVFIRDGAHAGVRAGAGIEVSVHRRIAIAAQASGVHFPEPGASFESTAFVPALGLVGRL